MTRDASDDTTPRDPLAELSPEEEGRWARYLAGAMPAAEREAFETHLLADPAWAERFYREGALDDALAAAVRDEAEPARPRAVVAARSKARRAWPRWAWAVPALAAAVLAGIALSRQAGLWEMRPGGTMRGDGGKIPAVTPVGSVAFLPDRFVWRATAEAALYRFALYDSEANLVLQRITRDTTLAFIPTDLVDIEDRRIPESGHWIVTAMKSDGRTLRTTGVVPYTWAPH